MQNGLSQNIILDCQKFMAWHPDKIPGVVLGKQTLETMLPRNLEYQGMKEIAQNTISGFDVYLGDFDFGYQIVDKRTINPTK